MIKNILFDFDGVLAESVNVKTEAFKKLYLPYGDKIVSRVVEHHLQNGGVSRFEKIKLYHESWLNIKLSDSLLDQLLQKFSDCVFEEVIASPEVIGSHDFLEKFKNDYSRWIITGTPTEEMKKIAERRGISEYFVDIFGSPNGKVFWTDFILKEWKLNPFETVFIGDAKSDFEAATQNGIHFILRIHDENKHVFHDYSGIKIDNLVELEKTLKLF